MNEKNAGHYIKHISDYVEAEANRELEQYGLTWSQARVLSFLLDRRDTTTIQKDIETFFEIRHPTVIGILQRMEAKGLVVCSVDPNDKRQRIVSVTPSAVELQADIEKHRVESELRMTRGLSPEEVRTFKQLLYKVYKNTVE
ncbi:MAG: MarR family winged helix-turn-helix transcriptional regulator [Oscillospiraceae bacterium]|jgi:MarR family transcriptional repressor of mepA